MLYLDLEEKNLDEMNWNVRELDLGLVTLYRLGVCLMVEDAATDATTEDEFREWLRMVDDSASDRRRRRTFAAMNGGVEPERG